MLVTVQRRQKPHRVVVRLNTPGTCLTHHLRPIRKRKFGHAERQQGFECPEERPREDTARRRPSASRRERPREKPDCPHLDLSLLASRTSLEKVNFCSLSHSVYGILSRQPQQTTTISNGRTKIATLIVLLK